MTEPQAPLTSTIANANNLVEPMLRIDGVTAHYGRIQALHGIDMEIRPGELVALVGANGAGKSTLLNCISGLLPATAGSISFEGQDITNLAAEKRVRRGIAQVPEGRQIFTPLSVADNLRLGAYGRRDRDGIATDLERMYNLFPILRERARQIAGTLSGGQQQMLAMARALMSKPRLLLLDEPSMGLSPRIVADLFAMIQRLVDDEATVLLVEQNAMMALKIATRAYVIETGEISLEGPGEKLLADERVRAAYLGI